jgi:hypothetical protein
MAFNLDSKVQQTAGEQAARSAPGSTGPAKIQLLRLIHGRLDNRDSKDAGHDDGPMGHSVAKGIHYRFFGVFGVFISIQNK